VTPRIAAPAQGFKPGLTAITRSGDAANDSGIGLAVLRLARDETWATTPDRETAWLLMDGNVQVRAGSVTAVLGRASLFDESASCVHAAAGTEVVIRALTDVEFTVYDCANAAAFDPRIFRPADVPDEHRGQGLVRNRSLRLVRTIFDTRNSPAAAMLVLGEVVTLPGGWSSYPPHHHPQPELYHYRFTAPQGYGHAELGESVVKVRQSDTVCILPGNDHAQCAAPGYGMYYSWVIRHLPGQPYVAPEFAREHAWTLSPDATVWWPGQLRDE
jgi:5-deoxy-glucuronate isomerase